MQRRVERSLTDVEHVIGELLDPPRDGIAVRGPPGERLEHQQVEGALEQVERRTGHLSHRLSMGVELRATNRNVKENVRQWDRDARHATPLL